MKLGRDDEWQSTLERRKAVQEDEKDVRNTARDCEHFVTDEWGQWEDSVTEKWTGRPRYQLDRTSPVIDRVASDLEQMEFGGSVTPFGGDASDDVADTIMGMIRTIDNMSNSAEIYQSAGRRLATSGFAAWLIRTDWADIDAFDQDMIIMPLINAIDRVWIEGAAYATKPSDIKGAFVDTFLSNEEYKQQFPEGSAMSVANDRQYNFYSNPPEGVTVTDFYYIKTEQKQLYLMTNGKVYDGETYAGIAESLKERGIVPAREPRARNIPKAYMRKLDAGGWLTGEQELPFSFVPVIGCWANKSVLENKIRFEGEVKRLMGPQRIYNYGASRDLSDGALAPVEKTAMTPKQAKGHEKQNSRLNTANDPLFLYNPDPEAERPYKTGGPQPNAQLATSIARAAEDIQAISQSFDPVQGNGISGHSGRAYEILTQNSNSSSYKYIKALKSSLQWTYEIVVDAIPRVYDTKMRQMRLTNNDGTTKDVAINEEVISADGKSRHVANDLSQGRYSFKVSAGPSYASKAAETVDVLTKWAQVDPSLLAEGGDIIYKNMQQEGMEQIAARKRKSMIEAGQIPEDQLTDEEREKIIKQTQDQQDQPPSEMDRATVGVLMAQMQELQSQSEERINKMQIDMLEQQRKMFETQLKAQKQEADIQKVQSETLENLRDATGADAVINGSVANAYDDIAKEMSSDNS